MHLKCISAFFLFLQLISSTLSVPGDPRLYFTHKKNIDNNNHKQIEKIKQELMELETGLEAVEDGGLEREGPITKKVKDLSESELRNLKSVLYRTGDPIDNDGIAHPNPLDKGPPPDVTFVTPGKFPTKNKVKAIEVLGRFEEAPVDDSHLGGHVVRSNYGIKSANKEEEFGAVERDVLEDIESRLIADLQYAKQHGLSSQDILKDLELKKVQEKAEKLKGI